MDESINDVFRLLDKWAKYPNYQLERRADIFFALHLSEIMKIICKEEKNIDDSHIVPEFPLRDKIYIKGNRTYHSRKVDYAVFGEKVLYLIELKTTMDDVKDIKTPDIKYLIDAKKLGVNQLISDICDIRNSSSQFMKYDTLKSFFDTPEVKKRIKGYHNNSIKIVYIIPIDPENEKYKDYSIATTFKCNKIEPICFSKILKELPDTYGSLTKRFKDSLKTWVKIEEDKVVRKPNAYEKKEIEAWRKIYLDNKILPPNTQTAAVQCNNDQWGFRNM